MVSDTDTVGALRFLREKYDYEWRIAALSCKPEVDQAEDIFDCAQQPVVVCIGGDHSARFDEWPQNDRTDSSAARAGNSRHWRVRSRNFAATSAAVRGRALKLRFVEGDDQEAILFISGRIQNQQNPLLQEHVDLR